MLAVALTGLILSAGDARTQDRLPSLPDSRLLKCSKQDGIRADRSDTVRSGEWAASFVGLARSAAGACDTKLELEIARDGHEARRVAVDVAHKHTVHFVGFSVDQSLMALTRWSWNYRDDQNVDIAVFSTSAPVIEWMSPWELLHWKDCLARVHPRGFTKDNKLLVETFPTGYSSARKPDCLETEKTFSFDAQTRTVSEVPAATEMRRYGSVEFTEARSCSADPDIVGECFSMRGRLSLYNGSPTVRIWRIGTKRMLGLENDFSVPYPNWRELMNFDNQMFATFKVCPLTPERPGHMQTICIDSVDKVVIQERDHLPFATGLPASGR